MTPRFTRRRGLRFAAVVVMATLAAAAYPGAALADGTYVTIMFSRAQVQAVTAPNCTPVPNGVPIWQVAQDLGTQGYRATEAVTTTLEAETADRCNSNGDLTLSWAHLRQLQSQYGWEIVPRGSTDDRTASTSQQYDDSCALLPTFYSEGFANAWSMYAYFGGPYSTTMQSDVVATCFAFGRTYRVGANALPVPSPYLVKVFSINGGFCNDTTLPCHTVSAPYEYTLPSTLASLVQSTGWDIIQGYKFVTGSYSSSAVSWDCTGADPASHWSTRSEFYCYNDWQSVIAAIPATAQVVSSTDMALLQNRSMKRSVASLVVSPSQATIVPGGSQAFTAEGFDSQGNDLGDETAVAAFSIDGTGSCTGAICTASDPGVHTVTATMPDGGATGTAQLTVADAAPAATGLAPTTGHVGDTVTITGTGLDTVSGVAFNGSAAAFTIVSPTEIDATVPGGATDGPVTISAPGGFTQQAGSFAVQPTITSFTPATGGAGTTVTISGSAFLGATQVTIAGVGATFTVSSYSTIKATVPAITGPGPITVTTPNGTATSAASFQPRASITSFTPTSGRVGATVTITGSGFTGASSVAFNGASAAFTVTSNTTITTTVPAAASTGKIAVTVSGATTTSAASFSVIPTISSFAPTSGRPGTAVTITGTGFTHATKVLFAGVAATYTVTSPTTITTTVPTGAKTGKITVGTAGGSATSATKFTVLRAAASAPALHR